MFYLCQNKEIIIIKYKKQNCIILGVSVMLKSMLGMGNKTVKMLSFELDEKEYIIFYTILLTTTLFLMYRLLLYLQKKVLIAMPTSNLGSDVRVDQYITRQNLFIKKYELIIKSQRQMISLLILMHFMFWSSENYESCDLDYLTSIFTNNKI